MDVPSVFRYSSIQNAICTPSVLSAESPQTTRNRVEDFKLSTEYLQHFNQLYATIEFTYSKQLRVAETQQKGPLYLRRQWVQPKSHEKMLKKN